jgi:tripartite-type tricarboxylate transporter receptor subunit TctC
LWGLAGFDDRLGFREAQVIGARGRPPVEEWSMPIVHRRSLLAGLGAVLAAPAIVRAQGGWPQGRTVRVVVPFAAGGSSDVVGRVLFERLSEVMGARFVIENRGGAGGNIGYAEVVKAEPDGSAVLFTSSAVSTMQALYPSQGFEPLRDLLPVSLIAYGPSLVVVGPHVKAAALADLVADARANPGKYSYASAGPGSGLHLGAAIFAQLAKIQLTHVPYKGVALAIPDILSGRVDMVFDPIASIRPQLGPGKLRALAVTSAKRTKLAPEFAPAAETVPGYDYTPWWGAFLPARTPPEIAAKLQAGIAEVLRSGPIQERYSTLGADPVGSTAPEFRAHLEAEIARMNGLIRELGIKLEG